MKKVFFLSIALTFTLTGCYPTSKRSVSDAAASIDDVMSLADETENFTLSLTLPESYPPELPKITTTVKRWDKETVYDALSGGKPIIREEESPSDAYPDEKLSVLFLDERNSAIYFEPGRMGYHAPLEGTINYSIFFSCLDLYYVDPFISYVSELESFSKEEAVQRVRDEAEKLGIANLGEPTVFGVTAESANEYHLNEKREAEFFGETYDYITWTRDDEAYFITFPFVYEGVQRDTNDVFVPEFYYDCSSSVKAIVTKNEIIDLECRGITMPEYTVGEPVKINYSAKDILSAIVSDYSQIKLPVEVEFYNCELLYAPVEKNGNEWVLSPVWVFDYCMYGDVYNDYFDTVFDELPRNATRNAEIYNAETGKRIAYEQQ